MARDYIGITLMFAAYVSCAAFWVRLISHAVIWCRTAGQFRTSPADAHKTLLGMYAVIAIDIILFRRLFNTNKLLWLGSWTFHISFLLVILRHLRFFIDPVPDWIIYIQPFGLVAGYILPISLLYVLILRLRRENRYVSAYNYFILCIVFLISMIGLLMRNYFIVDVVDAKEFVIGISMFSPAVLPANLLFIIHFFLVLILIPFLPLHIFTAPVTTMEARKREEKLKTVLHEK